MPNQTFYDLNNTKKIRVEQSLLKEFSKYPLSQARVSRIVVEAEISRGSFYKYFEDIQDSYQYLINKAIGEIHAQLPDISDGDSSKYADWIKNFINRSDKSGYNELIYNHFKYNEGTLGRQASPVPEKKTTTKEWSDFILFHQVFADIVLEPQSMNKRLDMLKQYLKGGK